jgi:hypothetical protein
MNRRRGDGTVATYGVDDHSGDTSAAVKVVDDALGLTAGRLALSRSEVLLFAQHLGTARLGPNAALEIAAFTSWANTLEAHSTPALPVADALLDIRLAISKADESA